MPSYTKHHFVPVAYLKGFTNESNKLYRFKLKAKEYEKKIVKLAPKQVAYISDLYTVKDSFLYNFFGIENDSKIIERESFRELENNIRDRIVSLSAGGIVKREDREFICFFILVSYFRHPYMLAEIENNLKSQNIIAQAKDELLAKIVREKKLDSRSKRHLEDRLNALDSDRLSIKNMSDIIFKYQILCFTEKNNKFVEEFIKNNSYRRFIFHKREGNVPFITSNNPVVVVTEGSKQMPSYYMPLNEKIVLEICGNSDSDHPKQIIPHRIREEDFVHFVNKKIIESNCDEIYSSRKDIIETYFS